MSLEEGNIEHIGGDLNVDRVLLKKQLEEFSEALSGVILFPEKHERAKSFIKGLKENPNSTYYQEK